MQATIAMVTNARAPAKIQAILGKVEVVVLGVLVIPGVSVTPGVVVLCVRVSNDVVDAINLVAGSSVVEAIV